MISKKLILVLVMLIIVSPIFGVILPEMLQSEEFIESLAEIAEPVLQIHYNAPLKDYTIPGFPEWVGYMVSSAIGLVIIVLVYYTIAKIMEKCMR